MLPRTLPWISGRSSPSRTLFACVALTGFCALEGAGCSDAKTTAEVKDAGVDVSYVGIDTDESGEYGGIISPSELKSGIHLLPPAAFADPPVPVNLPTSVILDNLPSVATQGSVAVPPGERPAGPLGSPGTCEPQAFGRGLGSFTAARNADGSIKWDPTKPENLVSAAWLYDWLQANGKAGPCPKGGGATPYLEHLVTFGAPSEADYPYMPVCTYLSNTAVLSKTYGNESRLRIGGFGVLAKQPGIVDTIKAFVAAGQVVGFSEAMLPGYTPQPVLVDGVFYGTGKSKGGHAQIVVGYDDNIGAPGRRGAFLVQNSMSPEWGSHGQVYFGYEAFTSVLALAAAAWPLNPSAGGTPLTGSSSTNESGPAATIVRAFQWSPMGKDDTYIVLVHHFAAPVRLVAVALSEPHPATHTVRASLSVPMSDFYTYFKRSDGKEFLTGTWGVGIDATIADGTLVHYEADVNVGEAGPQKRSSAEMNGVEILGPSEEVATVQ